MAEASQYQFLLVEVGVALIKHQGITNGRWQVGAQLEFSATNVGPNPADLKPSAVVRIVGIALSRAPDGEEGGVIIDAAAVNPQGQTAEKTPRKK